VKLGELCILGDGVWLLLLWLLQRMRLSVFSEAEQLGEEDGDMLHHDQRALGWRRVNSRVDALGRGHLAATGLSPWGGAGGGVQAFGVADVFEDPSSKVHQAAVLRQHQARPRVTLRHVQGGDGHSTPHLVDNHSITTSLETTNNVHSVFIHSLNVYVTVTLFIWSHVIYCSPSHMTSIVHQVT